MRRDRRTMGDLPGEQRRIELAGSGHHGPNGHSANHFCSNFVSTTKYELWNIIPKNLFEQFHRVANVWFLIVSFFQMLPLHLSPTSQYATLFPLLCVLFATFCKDAYEDYQRRLDDQRVNNQLTRVFDCSGAIQTLRVTRWKDVSVGDFVQLETDQPVPADMILLGSSNEDGQAFVDTAQLDGETSLKPKCCPEVKVDTSKLNQLEGYLTSEAPMELVQSYKGALHLTGFPRAVPVDAGNLLLRGSTLRRTDWIVGLVVFTGTETKIVMNSRKTPSKRSRVEGVANKLLVIVFFVLVVAAFAASMSRMVYMSGDGKTTLSWVWPEVSDDSTEKGLAFITFMIGFNNLIPISLYVTMDLVRTFQARMMERDPSMYYEGTNSWCRVRNSGLCENLGQVEFILSDKTGTLTENEMRFKACAIDGKIYGRWDRRKGVPVDDVMSPPPLSVTIPLCPILTAAAQVGQTSRSAPSSPPSPLVSPSSDLGSAEVCSGPASYSAQAADPPRLGEQPRAAFLGFGARRAGLRGERSGHSPGVKMHNPRPPLSPSPGMPAPEVGSLTESESAEKIDDFFLCLATCHTAIIERLETKPKRMGSRNGRGRGSKLPSDQGNHMLDGESSLLGTPQHACSLSTPQLVGMSTDELPSQSAPPPIDRAHQELIEEAMTVCYRSPSPDEEALVQAAKEYGYFLRSRAGNRLVVNVGGVDRHYHVLVCNDFSSERKRMSVLVRRVTVNAPADIMEIAAKGSAYALEPPILYAKGADNVMLERLALSEDSSLARRQLHQFSLHGLRTLVVAKRTLTEAEGESFVEKFMDAKSAFIHGDEMVQAVVAGMECNFEVVGITAVEDKIQEGVPESIDQFLRAGIKVWMLTGDNVETAINIATGCRLITPDMKKFTLEHTESEPGPLGDKLHSFYQEIRQAMQRERSPGEFKYAVILHGKVLYTIMEQDNVQLRLLFLTIACSSSSVVACRLAPRQKAAIVGMVRGSLAGSPVTLAVGDGGNDVSMIQEAHVGVGILGVEGRQAANAAEFVIGQFRFLSTLLLVHGRWNLRRTSMAICYSFYKNMLLVLPMVYYAGMTGFSATTLYDSYFLMIYNLVFTSLPIVITCVFDFDVHAKFAHLVPGLYRAGILGEYFNGWVLCGWIARGISHSCLMFFTMYMLFGCSTRESAHIEADYMVMGCWAYWTCVAVANMTLLLHTRALMDWFLVVLFGSVLLFIPVIMLYSMEYFSGIFNPMMFGVGDGLLRSLSDWLALLLVVLACSLGESSFLFASKTLRPRWSDILQEIQNGYVANLSDVDGQQDDEKAARGKVRSRGSQSRDYALEACLRQVVTPRLRQPRVKPEAGVTVQSLCESRPLKRKTASNVVWRPPVPVLPEGPLKNDYVSVEEDETLWRRLTAFLEAIWRSRFRQMPVGDVTLCESIELSKNLSSMSRKSSEIIFKKSSPGEEIAQVTYSALTLAFVCSQTSEENFRRYATRYSRCVFALFFIILCLVCCGYSMYDLLVREPSNIIVDATVAGLTGFAPCFCVLFFKSQFFQRHTERIILALFIICIILKQIYDTLNGNSGILWNIYAPVFVVTCTKMRFPHICVTIFVHLFVVLMRYGPLRSIIVVRSYYDFSDSLSKNYFEFIVGIAILSMYYSYLMEYTVRYDFAKLESLRQSKQKSIEILRGMFPSKVVVQICEDLSAFLRIRQDRGVVTVLFCDIMGFNELVEQLDPTDLVQLLDLVWLHFDRKCERHGILKIETVGKTYMAAAMPELNEDGNDDPHTKWLAAVDNARSVLLTGMDFLKFATQRATRSGNISVQIGVHTGQVYSGIVGSRKPQFALFGDTVNTASRMQSTGQINRLHMSSSTYELVRDLADFTFEPKQTLVKGKGLMDTYLVVRFPKRLDSHNIEIVPDTPSSETFCSDLEGGSMRNSRVFLPSDTPNSFCSRPILGSDTPNSIGAGSGQRLMNGLSLMRAKGTSAGEGLPSAPRKTVMQSITIFASESRKLTGADQDGTIRADEFRSLCNSFIAFWCLLLFESIRLVVRTTEGGGAAELWQIFSVTRGLYLLLSLTCLLLLRWGGLRQAKLLRWASVSIMAIVFIGFMCSILTFPFIRLEDLDFLQVTEAMFFVTVLSHCCRLILHLVIPIIFVAVVPVATLFFLLLRKASLTLIIEGAIYSVLIVVTQLVSMYGDPRRWSRDEQEAVRREHQRVNQLLDNMLPPEVLQEFRSENLSLAYSYQDMTLLFADIVGFTQYCYEHTAEEAVNLVTTLFSEFDEVAVFLGTYKVCTIGDAYVAVNKPRMQITDKHGDAERVLEFAMAMLDIISNVRDKVMHSDLDMRIGLHCGRFVGGVVGTRRVRFDIWGEDVLIANKVESNGIKGKISVSESCKLMLEEAFENGHGKVRQKQFTPHTTFKFKAGHDVPTYICEPLGQFNIAALLSAGVCP